MIGTREALESGTCEVLESGTYEVLEPAKFWNEESAKSGIWWSSDSEAWASGNLREKKIRGSRRIQVKDVTSKSSGLRCELVASS
jgi:hypothetical protein